MEPGRSLETIAIASLETRYGPAVAAASAKGLCLLQFGAGRETAEADLARAWPNAVAFTEGRDGKLENMLADLFAGKPVPVDPKGTAFQRSVWKALLRIPSGKTASYSDVAEAIGHPKAVRAVAMACAANRIAVAIPCHRVVRADGSLSGYRWGADLKRALLAEEAANGQGPESSIGQNRKANIETC